MSKSNNGGPAFPVFISPATAECLNPDDLAGLLRAHQGMVLRDFFAAAALTGILASDQAYTADDEASKPCQNWEDFASAAYQAAGAMLAERSKS